MGSHVYEFEVAMTCEGCSRAVEKALGSKPGISNINIDLQSQKVQVTSTLSEEEVSNYLKKTGKTYSFLRTVS